MKSSIVAIPVNMPSRKETDIFFPASIFSMGIAFHMPKYAKHDTLEALKNIVMKNNGSATPGEVSGLTRSSTTISDAVDSNAAVAIRRRRLVTQS